MTSGRTTPGSVRSRLFLDPVSSFFRSVVLARRRRAALPPPARPHFCRRRVRCYTKNETLLKIGPATRPSEGPREDLKEDERKEGGRFFDDLRALVEACRLWRVLRIQQAHV